MATTFISWWTTQKLKNVLLKAIASMGGVTFKMETAIPLCRMLTTLLKAGPQKCLSLRVSDREAEAISDKKVLFHKEGLPKY